MMVERAKTTGEISIIYLLLKFLFVFIFNLKFAISTIDNHSCYSCVEPLVGYSKEFLF
jgi:hypothetical protein